MTELVKAKIRLYLVLIRMDVEELSDADVEMTVLLAKDPAVQELLEKGVG